MTTLPFDPQNDSRMNFHPELKKILRRIGMKDQLCCPLCVEPKVFKEHIFNEYFPGISTNCIHQCDIYLGTRDIISTFYCTVLNLRLYCDVLFQEIEVKDKKKNIVTIPLHQNFFSSEQDCIRKLKLYLTLL